MRVVIVIFAVFAALVSKAQEVDSIWVSESKKKLSINTIEKDFGVFIQNEKSVFKFRLKNLNDEPLVVWHVTTSCGCTSPNWTEKPVKNNNDAIIKVKYDSSKPGVFNKSVFVYTNFDDKPIKLTIKGNVIANKTSHNLTKRYSSFKATLPTTN